ncbi:2-polyprenyl-6-methoxyphenol hydroxylase-like FAD-dependent oxidoreductase [Bacillus pakistanensis]|uniref:2-polyprenyl-6-methoxyphenol hydroxylase-like FAD-dependent oxidoreductase n=1 Tax=Rossellomorea pakistanensis TaxID=992288 RepID=A0ABS2NI01_9BACI|nr:FAD-dependent monooxygenase [Bacillus pakistanensis]MBM7587503.1 2-polyprenyl-6-methoxyphenol hydroxylase-like FAD-dependent oxidoreductase [Bacillus pakistanensis]
MNNKIQYDVDVLISGAGPTGLTLACELIRFGVSCIVIDKAESTSTQTKALGVMARTLEHLERMGVAQEFINRGHPTGTFNAYSGEVLLARLDFNNTLKSLFPFVLMIPQNITENILYSYYKNMGGKVEWNTELTSFTHDRTGVEAKFLHSDGSLESIKAKYLIGCDGAHSFVRHSLPLEFEGITLFQQQFALADLVVDSTLPDNEIFAFVKNGKFIAYFPMKDGQHRIMITTEDTLNPHSPVGLEEIQSVIDEAGPKGAIVHSPTWTSRFQVNQRKVKKGNIGRIFLAGDAAHIHSPVGAQGMNTGMQDSFNLGWKLAYVLKHQCSPDLLDSYTEEREPVWSSLLKGTELATRMILKESHFFQIIRNIMAPKVTSINKVKVRLMNTLSQVGIHYRSSSIVEEGKGLKSNTPMKFKRKKSIYAGDRAPNGLINNFKLFEVNRGIDLIILLFLNNKNENHEYREKLMKQNVPYQIYQITSDPNYPQLQEYKHHLGIIDQGIVVVRPDDYISFICEEPSPELLMQHLEKFSHLEK